MGAIDDVIAGFFQFRDTVFHPNRERFRQLAVGQRPKVMIVACCDSRVSPAMLINAAPGELFTLRNIANLVPPCEGGPTRHGTSAALEYAVRALEVEAIVVLGHARCGGIRALLEADPSIGEDRQFINHWMRIADPARARTMAELGDRPLDEQARFCEQESVRLSLANLMTFPWIRERVEDGRLSIHGWYFDIADASMYRYDPAASGFREITGPGDRL